MQEADSLVVSAQAFWLSLELSHLCTSVGNVPSAQVVSGQLIINFLSFSLVPAIIIRVGTPGKSASILDDWNTLHRR